MQMAGNSPPPLAPPVSHAENALGIPYLGFGLGLRRPHTAHILDAKPAIDWFEIISENYMGVAGKPRRILSEIRANYPIVMHGVSLSIGTVDALSSEYLHALRALADWLKPAWISDHLCWTGVAHLNTHDLLPVPYTEEALLHIIDRIKAVQDFLGRPICIENPSTYLEFSSSSMPEAEFIARMAEGANCGLLLDVNNIYVSCFNHRLDVRQYLDALPLQRVAQIHLAGHSNKGTHIVDTHDAPVIEEVWQIYAEIIRRAGRLNTMVEWDSRIPEFPVLMAELERARHISAAILAGEHSAPTLPNPALPDLAADLPAVRPNMRPPLAQQQAEMQSAILKGSADAALLFVRPKPDFAPAAQLGVYLKAYRLRLLEVTDSDFPLLRYLLGDQKMDALLADYVEANPSSFYDAGRYAAGLPHFMAGMAAFSPLVHDVARFEAELGQMHYAADSLPLRAEDIAALTPEALMGSRLFLRAGTKLMAFSFPIQDYEKAFKAEQNPTAPDAAASYLALFRHEESIWRLALSAEEYKLLLALNRGETVGEALENLMLDADAESASLLLPKLSEWFARWMRNGLLAQPTREAIAA